MRDSRQQVIEQVTQWRDELINLSRRNKLLYFRHSKTSTFDIEQPGPVEVLARLQIRRSGWNFYFPPDPPEDDGDGEEAESIPAPPPPQSDELITSKPDTKSLKNSLKQLHRRTTQEFLNKGLWVRCWTGEVGPQGERF